MPENVFFSRCRPQGADAIELVKSHRRVFIGYPAWRDGSEDRKALGGPKFQLRSMIQDLNCPEKEWAEYVRKRTKANAYQKQISQNRNFVGQIGSGSIALVPRPSHGCVYAGYVIGNFELLDEPPWAEEYLSIRSGQELRSEPLIDHIADVAQGWKVNAFKEISFFKIPAWVRHQLFGRSTYGIVRDWSIGNGEPFSAYTAIKELMEDAEIPDHGQVSTVEEIEERLVKFVSPAALEHLAVGLLQLEHPEQVWMHVGGCGDGGVDGIGTWRNGALAALLQCKWKLDSNFNWPDDLERSKTVTKIVATLHYEGKVEPTGFELLSRRRIAECVLKHRERLPIATSLGIRN